MPVSDKDDHDAQSQAASNPIVTSPVNGSVLEGLPEPPFTGAQTTTLCSQEGINRNVPGAVCGVCNKKESKYICSRCGMPFCCVACSTLHRASHPSIDEETTLTPAQVGATPSNTISSKFVPGTVSSAGTPNPFTVLEKSQELQTLFVMYPRLRAQLRGIYKTTLPPMEELALTAGDSTETHESLRVRERGRGRGGAHGRDSGPWNTDRGTQEGIDALKEQSEQDGKFGEGIREFSVLVLKIVSLEGVDVAKLVQAEVAEENAKIIAQLLNGDSY